MNRSACFVLPVACFTLSMAFAVFTGDAASAQGTKTVWDGVYTAEQAKRGGTLYQMHCGACHGEVLQGVESAPPLVGDTFNSTWEGVPLNELFERVRTTMPLTAPGSLSRAQVADVLAFMLESGKFPAGSAPLEPMTLGTIRFRTYRP